MGLGGVAIAVPPYVIHHKTTVLGRAGGWVFDWKNLVLRSNLTLLNANISKKSTFA